MPQKTATPVNPKVNDKWYNIRRFMGEKTQENSQMGYSAAYPTGRERMREPRYGCAEEALLRREAARSAPEGSARSRARAWEKWRSEGVWSGGGYDRIGD